MKKVDWSKAREIIVDLCFAIFVGFGVCSLALFLVAAYRNNDFALNISLCGLVIAISSKLIAYVTLIIDFICERKKYKKFRNTKPIVVIDEDIVV